ncbi:MAG TPA: hypothetical protein VKF36_12335 [Syntrophorhabdales bacterium]|nr:hypothetical protein [Syntrophorhabdales bacterium]
MTFNPNKHVFKPPRTISVCCGLVEDALHWKEIDVNDSGLTDGKTAHKTALTRAHSVTEATTVSASRKT